MKFEESTKLCDVEKFLDKSITVRGWVQNLRLQKTVSFAELRDGSRTTLFQVVFKDTLAERLKTESVCEETFLEATGSVLANVNAKGGVEMVASSFTVIGTSSPDYSTLKNESTSPGALAQIRHLYLRDPTPQMLLRGRALALRCMRDWLHRKDFTEVTPPAIVMNQVEGGSTLFVLNYFGKDAFLTQSSQLYLESVVPAVGSCYALGTNFRAEKSKTRRHLSEFTHLEVEVAALDLEGLLALVESLFVEVTETAIEQFGALIETLNPGFAERFVAWTAEKRKDGRPLRLKRLSHPEAIQFCNANGIMNDEGNPFTEGEDISEGPERKMIEMIGEPVLLTHFPVSMKPFYMRKDAKNPTLTESVDLLLPGVGEVLGGSTREGDYKTLIKGFEREGLDTKTYQWYLDLRKYGTCHSGGFGFGVERYLCWLFGQDNIRKVVLYPRTCTTCYP